MITIGHWSPKIANPGVYESRHHMYSAYTASSNTLLDWIMSLMKSFTIFGPVMQKNNQTEFEKLHDVPDIHLDYQSTMMAPCCCIYPSRQTLFTVERHSGICSVPDAAGRAQIIFGLHPCDMHAVTVLDRIFMGTFKDHYYSRLRELTATVVLNCVHSCRSGFCLSMETGPFLKVKDACDVELTPLEQDLYLVEAHSERGARLVETAARFKKAVPAQRRSKKRLEQKAAATFTKTLETRDLPQLLLQHRDHLVYQETARSRCLGCTNCTMVCPTCYCYSIRDLTSSDGKTTRRMRSWDSCQELHFAEVHGGNLRSSRETRLRQFVIHKLATWVEQYGCFGCIGCGRCMTWCPTGIDLTEIAKRIRYDSERKGARIENRQ